MAIYHYGNNTYEGMGGYYQNNKISTVYLGNDLVWELEKYAYLKELNYNYRLDLQYVKVWTNYGIEPPLSYFNIVSTSNSINVYNVSEANSLNFISIATKIYLNPNMNGMFYNCYNLIDINHRNLDYKYVTILTYTFYNCFRYIGEIIKSENIIDMRSAYAYCYNLPGTPWCGNNVENFAFTYYRCGNLTGSPVCGNNVINMHSTYDGCSKLTGTAVCGPKVENMYLTYSGCTNLSTPISGKNVQNMRSTYSYCQNLSSGCDFFENITDLSKCFENAYYIKGDFYFYYTSNNSINFNNMFYNHNNNYRINIHVTNKKETYLYNIVHNQGNLNARFNILGKNIIYVDGNHNKSIYNQQHNIYIYYYNDIYNLIP